MSLFGLASRIAVAGVVLALGAWPAEASAQAKTSNVIVYLDPMTTAGVGGTVNLAPDGDATSFEVTLNPGESVTEARGYKMQVVQGSCSTPGRVVQGFGEVRADGKARQQEGNLRLADVRTGNHVIQVAGKDRKEVVACGIIPTAGR